MIEEKYGIPRRRLHGLMSPWCYKRLEAFGGDISRFRVGGDKLTETREIAPYLWVHPGADR
jgi:serine protein kinase